MCLDYFVFLLLSLCLSASSSLVLTVEQEEEMCGNNIRSGVIQIESVAGLPGKTVRIRLIYTSREYVLLNKKIHRSKKYFATVLGCIMCTVKIKK